MSEYMLLTKRKTQLYNISNGERQTDFSPFYNGEIYFDGKLLCKFYEHPYEGGYYQNGASFGNMDMFYKEGREVLIQEGVSEFLLMDEVWLFSKYIEYLLDEYFLEKVKITKVLLDAKGDIEYISRDYPNAIQSIIDLFEENSIKTNFYDYIETKDILKIDSDGYPYIKSVITNFQYNIIIEIITKHHTQWDYYIEDIRFKDNLEDFQYRIYI